MQKLGINKQKINISNAIVNTWNSNLNKLFGFITHQQTRWAFMHMIDTIKEPSFQNYGEINIFILWSSFSQEITTYWD